MLVKLLPDQITRYWPEIKHGMLEAMPELANNTDESMNRVLQSMLLGKMDCWVSYRVNDDESITIDLLITTTITVDYCTGSQSFLIYTGWTPTRTLISSWVEAYQTFSKYAAKRKCDRIIMYSDNARVLRMMKYLGAETTYLISLPLFQDLEEGLHEDLFEASN